MPLNHTKFLAMLLMLSACGGHNSHSEVVPPPTDTTAFAMSWNTSKTGFVFTSEYFTAGEVSDPAWEEKRLSKFNRVIICQTGHQITHRDVRWFPATRESGQACAAIIYTVTCDIPTHAEADTLELDRQEALVGEMPDMPEKSCGEKDWTKHLDKPDYDIRQYLDAQSLLVDKPVCDFVAPDLNGKITIFPETRIGFSSVIDRALVARMDGNAWLARLGEDLMRNPPWVIGAGLHKAGKFGAIFPPTHKVQADSTNIQIKQAIGLGRDGRPSCVQVTATQGDQTWRRTIEHSGPDAYSSFGKINDDDHELLKSLTEAMGYPI